MFVLRFEQWTLGQAWLDLHSGGEKDKLVGMQEQTRKGDQYKYATIYTTTGK